MAIDNNSSWILVEKFNFSSENRISGPNLDLDIFHPFSGRKEKVGHTRHVFPSLATIPKKGKKKEMPIFGWKVTAHGKWCKLIGKSCSCIDFMRGSERERVCVRRRHRELVQLSDYIGKNQTKRETRHHSWHYRFVFNELRHLTQNRTHTHTHRLKAKSQQKNETAKGNNRPTQTMHAPHSILVPDFSNKLSFSRAAHKSQRKKKTFSWDK